MNKKSFTLIEVMMAVGVAAIILTPLSILIIQATTRAQIPEHYQIASALLEEELERVASLRFAEVVTSSGSFPGSFSHYSYQVNVDYVDGNDLTTPSGSPPTDYKRVLITVSRTGLPDLTATAAITNN